LAKVCLCLVVVVVVFLTVCTCVVHKRCHRDIVTICPGVKQSSPDEFAAVRYFYFEFYRFSIMYSVLNLRLQCIVYLQFVFIRDVMKFILHSTTCEYSTTSQLFDIWRIVGGVSGEYEYFILFNLIEF